MKREFLVSIVENKWQSTFGGNFIKNLQGAGANHASPNSKRWKP